MSADRSEPKLDQHFERSVALPVSSEEAYGWHARPGAFQRLSPPWRRLEILGAVPELAEGTRLRFRICQGPLRMTWVAEHQEVRPGRSFRDIQVRGPFAGWNHLHAFEPVEDGSCLLRDTVRYRLPGMALGRLLASAAIRNDLRQLFRYRHTLTRNDLEAHRTIAPGLRIAISGASGLLGTALTAFLSTGGHRVLRLVRGQPRNEDEVPWQPLADQGQALPDLGALEGLDAFIHLAGENVASGRWSGDRKARLRSSRVEATRNLVQALARLEQPPKAFLSASAIGYYGDTGAEVVDENQAQGSGFLAQLCADWEEAASLAQDLGCRTTCLRFGVVLSPAGGALAKMLPAFLAGGGGPIGGGRQLMSWIALDDVLYAIHHVLSDTSFHGKANLVAPEPVSQGELARTLGRVLRRPALVPVPAGMLRLAFGEMAEEVLLASCGVRPDRLRTAGFVHRHPHLEGALRHLLGRN